MMVISKGNPESKQAAGALAGFISEHSPVVLLTGAGISAGSGIPTYRDGEGTWLRSTPVQHQDFMTSERARRRYWLRSYKGWPAVAGAAPSAAHRAVTDLESLGHILLTVTQNVDRLHQKAGSGKVIDLHGRLDEVVCMNCHSISSRAAVQDRISDTHPALARRIADVSGTLAPDGDADIEDSLACNLTPPDCLQCGGIVKPNVVFFGDNVPGDTIETIYSAIDDAGGLVIAGTSLQVFSGYRFCRQAARLTKPIASVNPGKTRGDELIQLRLPFTADQVLPDAALALNPA